MSALVLQRHHEIPRNAGGRAHDGVLRLLNQDGGTDSVPHFRIARLDIELETCAHSIQKLGRVWWRLRRIASAVPHLQYFLRHGCEHAIVNRGLGEEMIFSNLDQQFLRRLVQTVDDTTLEKGAGQGPLVVRGDEHRRDRQSRPRRSQRLADFARIAAISSGGPRARSDRSKPRAEARQKNDRCRRVPGASASLTFAGQLLRTAKPRARGVERPPQHARFCLKAPYRRCSEEGKWLSLWALRNTILVYAKATAPRP
jgi:hypothetical protein